MSILLNKNTKVLVQGITGRMASRTTKRMLEYGTQVVAGVTVGRSGEEIHGVPVYDSVAEAVRFHEVDASVLYIPAIRAKEAALEAIDAGAKLVVIISEGVPIHDAMQVKAYAASRSVWVIGPNTPGVITPGEALMGYIAPSYATPGNIGLISRSGTLSFETIKILSEAGLGQSSCIGIGGDQVIGKTMRDYLQKFEEDPGTAGVVLVGEIGGNMEEDAADYINTMKKPVAAFIAGRSAPAQKRMGHAGAIVNGKAGTAEGKRNVLREAGAFVADSPWAIPGFLKQRI